MGDGAVKRCSKCETEKPVERFSTRSGAGDGLQAWCRPCMSAATSANNRRRALDRLGLPADYEGDIRGLARSKPIGSTSVGRGGYVFEKTAGHPRADAWGWVAQHILVAEEKYGIEVTREFTVHHKNRNRTDNRPSNLELRVGNHGKGGDLIDTLLADEDARTEAVRVLATYGHTIILSSPVTGNGGAALSARAVLVA